MKTKNSNYVFRKIKILYIENKLSNILFSKTKVLKETTGFTLAEVLITITIIGIIASLTIPNLVRKLEDRVQITALKTAYSLLNNAYKMAVADNGQLKDWIKPNDVGYSEYFGQTISKYLKIQQYCGMANGCFSYGYAENGNKLINSAQAYPQGVSGNIYSYNANKLEAYAGKMILVNGMRISSSVGSYTNPTYDSCILVDTNGKNGPNRVGYDIFYIGINQNSLEPGGCYWGKSDRACNPKKEIFPRDGASCSYWVLRHGNMDYKYRDVSSEW